MRLDLTVDERQRAEYRARKEFGDEAVIHYIEKHYRPAVGTVITYWVRVDSDRLVYKRSFHIEDF